MWKIESVASLIRRNRNVQEFAERLIAFLGIVFEHLVLGYHLTHECVMAVVQLDLAVEAVDACVEDPLIALIHRTCYRYESKTEERYQIRRIVHDFILVDAADGLVERFAPDFG